MRGIAAVALFLFSVLLDFCAAEAQQQRIPRIGYFGGSASANPQRLESFRLGLREIGYIEGKSILLELRFPEGDSQREHAVAAELVRLNVDVIVTVGSNATRRAKDATTTIPIVMTQDPGPCGQTNSLIALVGQAATSRDYRISTAS